MTMLMRIEIGTAMYSVSCVNRYGIPIEIFGRVSIPFDTVAINWHLGKILRRSSQGNPRVGDRKSVV